MPRTGDPARPNRVPELATAHERREPTITALLLLRSGMLATAPACGANCRIEPAARWAVPFPSRLGSGAGVHQCRGGARSPRPRMPPGLDRAARDVR